MAKEIQTAPTIIDPLTKPTAGTKYLNELVMGITAPLTKLGTVEVAVDRMLVPNCSAAMVTKRAQYPVPIPNSTHMK